MLIKISSMVNFEELYEKLADKQFQDTENTDFSIIICSTVFCV